MVRPAGNLRASTARFSLGERPTEDSERNTDPIKINTNADVTPELLRIWVENDLGNTCERILEVIEQRSAYGDRVRELEAFVAEQEVRIITLVEEKSELE